MSTHPERVRRSGLPHAARLEGHSAGSACGVFGLGCAPVTDVIVASAFSHCRAVEDEVRVAAICLCHPHGAGGDSTSRLGVSTCR